MGRTNKVTIYDIAQKAGVHPSTVSRTLNGNDGVKASTRALILKVAEELDYHPALIPQKHDPESLAVVVFIMHSSSPRAVGQFYFLVLQGIKEELSRHGYNLILKDLPHNDMDALIRFTRETKIAGIIFVGKVDAGLLLALQEEGIHAVVVDYRVDEIDMDFIMCDNLAGSRAATRLLIDRGHRHIGCVYADRSVVSIADRIAGYRLAIAEMEEGRGREILIAARHLDIDSGEEIVSDILKLPERPTALVAVNDELAIGLLSGLAKAKVHVPAEMAVIGFDDIIWAAYANPPLSTVSIDKRRMGALGVQRLIGRITSADHISSLSTLPTEIVIRSSL